MSAISNIVGVIGQTFSIGKSTAKRLITASSTLLTFDSSVVSNGFHIPSCQALTLTTNVCAWSWTIGSTTREMCTLSLATATANVTINITNMAIGRSFQLQITNHATTPVDVILPNPASWTIRYAGGKPTNLMALTANSVTILTFCVFGGNVIECAVMKDMKV